MDGFHVPVIPLGDTFAKAGAAVPEQNGGTAGKFGIRVGLTTILIDTGPVTHCPAFGVKVYTVVPGLAVLTVLFHVPLIGGVLVEFIGRTGGVAFWHRGATGRNVGVGFGRIVTVSVCVLAQVIFGVKI